MADRTPLEGETEVKGYDAITTTPQLRWLRRVHGDEYINKSVDAPYEDPEFGRTTITCPMWFYIRMNERLSS